MLASLYAISYTFLNIVRHETHLLDDSPHGSGQGCSHAKSSIVEDLHGNFEPVSRGTEHILNRDGGVLEVHFRSVGTFNTHLLLWGTVSHSSKSSFDDEGRDLLCNSSCLLIGNWSCAKNGEDLSNASVGDPDLASIKNPVCSSIRSTAWLGQGKGSKIFPSCKFWEILLLLGIS